MDPISISLTQPVVGVLKKVLKPAIRRISAQIDAKTEVFFDKIFLAYEGYLENAYRRHSFFISVVFGNAQKQLLHYYIPLTLCAEKSEIKIIDYPKKFVDNVENLLIVDTAGMGKTTLLKFMFLKCVEQSQCIPIFVELRKLSKRKPLAEYLLGELLDIKGAVPASFYTLLQSGKFAIFLDGYDEIPDAERPEIVAGIQKFIEKAPRNRYILSSRDDASLTQFAAFKKFTIRPLKKDEAYKLIRSFSTDELGEGLIEKLNDPANSSVHEFLGNPLLVSLLYKAYEHKANIPIKRSVFYRQVYEALFETHDLGKERGGYIREKKSSLDIDSFDKLLRSLAILTYKDDKTEFSKAELLEAVEKAFTLSGTKKVSASDFVDDLTHAVPLMIQDGTLIRWCHRSIQEYFAASYILRDAGEKRSSWLDFFAHGPHQGGRHANMLSLCADMDSFGFNQSILQPIAVKLVKNYTDLKLVTPPGVSAELVESRRRLLTGKTAFMVGLPSIPHTKQGHKDFQDNFATPMQEKMQSHMAGEQIRSWSWSEKGCAIVETQLHQLISSLMQCMHIPFVRKIRHNAELFDGPALVAIGECITFDSYNPTEDPKSYLNLNKQLANQVNYEFDLDAALDFINLVETTAAGKAELIDLLLQAPKGKQ